MMSPSTFHLVALLAALADIEAVQLAKPTLSGSGPTVDGSTSSLLYIKITSTVYFSCQTSESPKEYQWMKDGVLLTTTSSSTLQKSFFWLDSGTYTCKLIATNAADNSDPSNPVAVKAGGPILGSELVIKSSEITTSGATVTWEKPTAPSDSFTSYKVAIKPPTKGATTTVPTKDTVNPSCALSNLQSYTIYTVTVSTVTEYGSVKIEGFSKSGLFITQAAMVHVPVAMNIYVTSASMVAVLASVVSGT